MKNVTRADLSILLKDRFGISSCDAYKIIDMIFEEIKLSLTHGENVKITGLGSFNVTQKNARVGRNPRTKVSVVIPAHNVASFHPSKEFRKNLKNC